MSVFINIVADIYTNLITETTCDLIQHAAGLTLIPVNYSGMGYVLTEDMGVSPLSLPCTH